MWVRTLVLLALIGGCASLPMSHPNSTLAKKGRAKIEPQIALNIWSPLFSGVYSNGVCVDYALPVGTSTSFPSDTINKSFQMWINVVSYPSQYRVLYDTTNTIGVASYGHSLVVESDGTLYLQDWANNKVVLDNVIETGTWYYVCVVITRSTPTGTGYLYARRATDSAFAFNQATITTLSVANTGPMVVLGGHGTPSAMVDCFNGYIDSFGQWSSSLGWSQVEIAFQGGITASDWGLLGFYPMNGGNVGLGTSLPSTGEDPVTGTLVGATWTVVSGHNICLCNGLAPSDTLALCSGTSNGCNNYCESGYNGVTCLNCPAGYYGTAPACTCCPVDTYSNAGATSCTFCGRCSVTWSDCTANECDSVASYDC